MGKRVRFSHPLEYWKEFDQNTGFLNDLDNIEQLQKPQQEVAVVTSKDVCDSVDKHDNDNKQNRGKAVSSITEAVQAFRDEDEKTSVRKFIAHYKRTTVQLPDRISYRKNQDAVGIQFENSSTNSVQNKMENDSKFFKLCSNDSLGDDRLRYNNLSYSGKYYSPLRPPAQRRVTLPPLSKKTFEERLLPHSSHKDKSALTKYIRTDYRGVPVTQSTPFIVQLFE